MKQRTEIPSKHTSNVSSGLVVVWRIPFISALGMQREVDLCEFAVSLIYKVSSRATRTVTQRNQVSRNQTKTKKKKSFQWFSDFLMM